jgi:hypothetical protein
MIRTWQAKNVSVACTILAAIALLAGATAKAQSVQGVINGKKRRHDDTSDTGCSKTYRVAHATKHQRLMKGAP